MFVSLLMEVKNGNQWESKNTTYQIAPMYLSHSCACVCVCVRNDPFLGRRKKVVKVKQKHDADVYVCVRVHASHHHHHLQELPTRCLSYLMMSASAAAAYADSTMHERP